MYSEFLKAHKTGGMSGSFDLTFYEGICIHIIHDARTWAATSAQQSLTRSDRDVGSVAAHMGDDQNGLRKGEEGQRFVCVTA